MAADMVVETIQYDFNGDGVADQLQLLVPEGWEGSGDFTKIILTLSGQANPFQLENEEGWTNFDEYYVGTPNERNRQWLKGSPLQSSRAALVPVPKDGAYLFLFGYPYVSSPGRLKVLRITDKLVESVFEKEFQVLEVRDLNADGQPEMAGFGEFTEASSEEGAKGPPIEVYTFKQGQLRLEPALSANYQAP